MLVAGWRVLSEVGRGDACMCNCKVHGRKWSPESAPSSCLSIQQSLLGGSLWV
jgi:hypothetical protein